MDYDEFEDVLREDEEHNKNMSPEKKAKIERIHSKMESLMGEAAEAFMEPELIEKIESKVLGVMGRKKITPSVSNLKVFLLAFQFGMASKAALGNDAVTIAMGLKYMIDKREKAKPKTDIDITKSKPLTDEPEKLG